MIDILSLILQNEKFQIIVDLKNAIFEGGTGNTNTQMLKPGVDHQRNPEVYYGKPCFANGSTYGAYTNGTPIETSCCTKPVSMPPSDASCTTRTSHRGSLQWCCTCFALRWGSSLGKAPLPPSSVTPPKRGHWRQQPPLCSCQRQHQHPRLPSCCRMYEHSQQVPRVCSQAPRHCLR
jgi:hypothetical protein